VSSVVVESAAVVERSAPMTEVVELVLTHPTIAASVEPGQFVQVAVGAPHALLRRPYSVAWTDPQNARFGLIFNVVGDGSAWLSTRHEGHRLDILGPLGRGFELEGDGPAVVVAGGLGIAVFPGVAQALRMRGRPVLVLHGARTATQLLPAVRCAGADVRYATDDGSAGHHGSVVDLLQESSAWWEGERGHVDLFACGPTPMLRALIDRARRLELPLSNVQVALETPMGCGMGTCLGCAAPRRGGGYLLTCQEGPCVRADSIEWGRITDAFHD
jgi:dihydroorotate dehydrogenase electron transfer subunit